ncbi:hypothetical protein [Nocardia sp. BMG51109]|uniref:hypothetical protein n=1 Tax=Nocardia sp. BMG51109 TaxID=1056816 RepID=UPI0004AF7D30|nr:hypothetical protein [Nocardia sp. BMG51109]
MRATPGRTARIRPTAARRITLQPVAGVLADPVTAMFEDSRRLRGGRAAGELTAFLTDETAIGICRPLVENHLERWQATGRLAPTSPSSAK